ncbi:MAG TPA: BMP family ABC transporter substrate-binding protein [Tissierella sp.]|uniref:BMP family lipoprotein n=1 Tax=Tissierella praeacuta TaxID=43131 RepID=UPI000EC249F2|nr:BMP family ABC transporter substrate-binding protein [Tissierella praeacuta]HAE92168.1 BMP family ABC transporter substrate-binding protein [Tissierella sp.]
MKKILTILLVLVLIMGTLTGCKSEPTSPNNESKDQKDKLKVALVYAGFLGDKSFNDSAHEGAMRAVKDFGIEFKELESKEPTEWESNFVAMAAEGYDLVIGVSTQFQEIMAKHCPEFPDTKFAIIDGVVPGDNIVSSTFAQNEGSFLAGAAAAMFTTKTDITGVNPDKVIGWVGGMDIPVLSDFFVGYEQGAKYIDPEIKVLQSFAGTFNDPLKGKELTIAQYSQGADIVMNVASGTGNGILEAAKEQGKYAIGVDLDQDGVYPGFILTSMLKRVDNATYLAIESVVNGTFEGNTTTYLDISNGGVGLTDMSVMKEALGDKFPQDIVDTIVELEKKVKSGEIVVEAYEGFGRK